MWLAQCSIPVFAGLLPDTHNAQVLHLLFVLCHWHALAKLCLHTDKMLDIFESVTKELGNHIHIFVSDTCPCFATKELPREVEARRHHWCQNLSKSSRSEDTVSHRHGQQPKGLNLQTYKLHTLADYPSQIRTFGTTESYSTQSVRLAFHNMHVYKSMGLWPQFVWTHGPLAQISPGPLTLQVP